MKKHKGPRTREEITEMGAPETYYDQETNTEATDLPSIQRSRHTVREIGYAEKLRGDEREREDKLSDRKM